MLGVGEWTEHMVSGRAGCKRVMVEGEIVGRGRREGRRGEFRGESEGAEVRREEGVDESERWFEG